MQLFGVLGLAIAVLYLLLIPGLAVSYVLFPRDSIDIVERIAIALGLSFAVVPLLVFYLNLAGVTINLVTIFGEATLIIAGSLGFIYWRYRCEHQPRKPAVQHKMPARQPATRPIHKPPPSPGPERKPVPQTRPKPRPKRVQL